MTLKLFLKPGACSLSPHIALEEAGLPYETESVDLAKKVTASGGNYFDINPKGYVPALQLDSGELLTEIPALMLWIGDHATGTALVPPAKSPVWYQMVSWLGFIGTELHKGFAPLFRPNISDEARAGVVQQLSGRLKLADAALAGKSYLFGDRFCAADVYLFVVSGWSSYAKLDLSPYPSLQAFRARMMERPAVREAMKAEGLLQ